MDKEKRRGRAARGALAAAVSTAVAAAMTVSGLGAAALAAPAAAAAGTPQVITWGLSAAGELGPRQPFDTAPLVIPGLPAAPVQVATGPATYAVMPDGTVYDWGNNNRGQLGDPGFTGGSTATPRKIPGLPAIRLVLGGPGFTIGPFVGTGQFAAALDTTGNVWTWGDNTEGELGNGSSGGSDAQPVPVKGLSEVLQITSLGSRGVAVLLAGGHVDYWGKVSDTIETSPQPVPGLPSDIVQITNGLALGADGTVTVLDPSQPSPATVTGLPAQVSSVTGNGHTFLAIAGPNSDVWAWGENDEGQVGNGTTTDQATPVQLPLTRAVQVDVNDHGNSSAAVLSNGTVWQWGFDGLDVGTGWPVGAIDVPVQAPGVAGVSQLALSAAGAVAIGQLAPPGSVQAWGAGHGGQLGNGTTAASAATPVTVQGAAVIPRQTPDRDTGLTGVLPAVSSGASHSLAVGADGSVLAWGTNTFGQLGNGTRTSTSKPVSVPLPAQADGTPRKAVQVAAGGQFSLALADDGTVWSWGGNGQGQLGNGNNTTQLSPVQVSIPAGKVSSISAGTAFGLALADDGTVWGWGANESGELGNGTTQRSSTPQKITLPFGSGSEGQGMHIAAGSNFGVAESSGRVAAWGADDKGQLGNGTTEPMSTTPVVIDISAVHGTQGRAADGVPVSVAAGGSAAYLLLFDGTVWAWGDDSAGQLGDGAPLGGGTAPPPRTSPVLVSLPRGAQVVQLSGAGSSAVAYTASGTALSWGTGALGAGGSVTSSSTPVPVSLPGDLVMGIGAGPASGTALAVVEPLTPPGPVPTPRPIVEQVAVPDLTGLLTGAAGTTLQQAGLKLGAQTPVTDPGCDQLGEVVSQDPAPGTKVNQGTLVNVGIGTKPATTSCP